MANKRPDDRRKHEPIGRAWRPTLYDANLPDVPLTSGIVRYLYRCSDLTLICRLDIRDQHLIPSGNDWEQKELEKDLAKVTEISGGSNNLTLKVFSRFPDVKQLELQNNRIVDIPVFLQDYFQKVQIVDLSTNSLKNDCIEIFSFFPCLESLNVAYNNLTKFEYQNPAGFPVLRRVNLTGNQITSKGLRHISKLANLSELNLSRNRIRSVAHLVKGHRLAGVCYLDLSFNRVSDGHSLKSLTCMQLLSLVGNKLSKLVQDRLTHVFRKTKCRILWAETDGKHAPELTANLCSSVIANEGCVTGDYRKTLTEQEKMRDFLAKNELSMAKQFQCAETENQPADDREELLDLLSSPVSYPRPSNLAACYALLNELLHKPRASAAGLISRQIVTKFPVSSVKHHHKTFWNALEGVSDKMDRNWTRKDRLSDAIPESLTFQRRKSMTKAQIVKHQLKKYNLEKAVESVLQIDATVFHELLAYRQRIRDNRETVFELEDVLEEF